MLTKDSSSKASTCYLFTFPNIFLWAEPFKFHLFLLPRLSGYPVWFTPHDLQTIYLCYRAFHFIYCLSHLLLDCIFFPSYYCPLRFSPFSLLCYPNRPHPSAIGQQFLSWGRMRGSRRGRWQSPAAKATDRLGFFTNRSIFPSLRRVRKDQSMVYAL